MKLALLLILLLAGPLVLYLSRKRDGDDSEAGVETDNSPDCNCPSHYREMINRDRNL